MKIKKLLFAALLMVAATSYGQNNYIGQDYSVSPNVITTAVPFVSIAPDARGGSMGDCGVATDPDVYSMHYNAAKYVYLEDKFTVGLGYSPWLRNLVPDMNLPIWLRPLKSTIVRLWRLPCVTSAAVQSNLGIRTIISWVISARMNGPLMPPIHVCSAIICRVQWQVASSIPT